MPDNTVKQRLFESVVVALDSSIHPELALHPAVAVASQGNASLVLVSVAPPWDLKERQDYLRMTAVGLPLRAEQVVLPYGPPADVLIEALQSRQPCLPCMTSHGHGVIGQAIFGDVSARVVRELGGPVLAIGPHDHVGIPAYTEIIVAVDASRESTAILPVAARLAGQLDAKLQVVQVVDPDAMARAAAAGIPAQDLSEAGHVAEVARQLPDNAVASWDVLHHDDPAAGIVDYLSGHPSAIVAMTTHARSGLDLLGVGSVANHVVHASPCPVLLLH